MGYRDASISKAEREPTTASKKVDCSRRFKRESENVENDSIAVYAFQSIYDFRPVRNRLTDNDSCRSAPRLL
jgi:hypothetical protein